MLAMLSIIWVSLVGYSFYLDPKVAGMMLVAAIVQTIYHKLNAPAKS